MRPSFYFCARVLSLNIAAKGRVKRDVALSIRTAFKDSGLQCSIQLETFVVIPRSIAARNVLLVRQWEKKIPRCTRNDKPYGLVD